VFPVDELMGIAEQLAGRINLVDIAHVGVVVVGNVNNLLVLPCQELDGSHCALWGGGVTIEGGAGVWQSVASMKEAAKEL